MEDFLKLGRNHLSQTLVFSMPRAQIMGIECRSAKSGEMHHNSLPDIGTGWADAPFNFVIQSDDFTSSQIIIPALPRGGTCFSALALS